MRSKEKLLTAEAAARYLGISAQTIKKMAYRGQLPNVKDGRGYKFRFTDIRAYAVTNWKDLDFSTVASMTLQSKARVATLEMQVTQIQELLGVDTVTLELTEEAILALYSKASIALRSIRKYKYKYPDAKKIMYWSKIAYAMTEEYLQLVSLYTGSEEPWRVFIELLMEYTDRAPREQFALDRELEYAFGHMAVARKNLRRVAYFYTFMTAGEKIAKKQFPVQDFDHHIISLIYNQ